MSAPGPLSGGDPALLPSLVVALGARGAAAPTSLANPLLRAWLPGDDGFGADALAAALSSDAALDEVLVDLLAARGDVARGFDDLVERWTATDGLVTLPDAGLPAGVTGHRPAELAHGEPLGGELVAEVLGEIRTLHLGGAAPAVTVYVAVDGGDRHGAPAVLLGAEAGVPAGRTIDLTAPGLPPEAFTPPAAPGGGSQAWAVRLGTRAACRLPDGHPAGPDPDGVAGQAARLRRVLAPLAGAGADVVAHGGAGHAAVRAVAGWRGCAAWSRSARRGRPSRPTPWTRSPRARRCACLPRSCASWTPLPRTPPTPPPTRRSRTTRTWRAPAHCVAALLGRDPLRRPAGRPAAGGGAWPRLPGSRSTRWWGRSPPPLCAAPSPRPSPPRSPRAPGPGLPRVATGTVRRPARGSGSRSSWAARRAAWSRG